MSDANERLARVEEKQDATFRVITEFRAELHGVVKDLYERSNKIETELVAQRHDYKRDRWWAVTLVSAAWAGILAWWTRGR